MFKTRHILKEGVSMEKKTFECGGKKAALYCSGQADHPLIVLNSYSEDGTSVIKAMREIGAPECNLLVVSNLRWDQDLTPWYCPPVTQSDTPYTGEAAEYLNLLVTQILPEAKTMLAGEPCCFDPFSCALVQIVHLLLGLIESQLDLPLRQT